MLCEDEIPESGLYWLKDIAKIPNIRMMSTTLLTNLCKNAPDVHVLKSITLRRGTGKRFEKISM